jgi:hypothetical protein
VGRRKEAMERAKEPTSKKEEQKYIKCPWCGEKVRYARRAGHGCFKFHLSEIARNAEQMSRG